MALQLNPTVADPFDTLPLYQFRRNLFDAMGFVYSPAANGSTFEVPFFADSASFAQMGPLPASDGGAQVNTPNSLVYEIKQRLGLPNALGIKTDNVGTLITQLCNFIGLGAMMKFLPGNVIPLLTNFLNQAEQDIWRDIELDSGGLATGATLISPPNRMGMAAVTSLFSSFVVAAVGASQTCVVNSASGLVANITNTGVNITDGVNTITGVITNVAGTSITVKTVSVDSGVVGATMAVNAVFAFGSVCTLDSTAIMQRAIALAKDHYGQDDGQLYMQQSQKYVGDYARRSPPNITSIIQLALIDAQRKILRRPELGGISFTTTGTKYADVGTFRSSFNNQAATYPNSSGTAFTLPITQFLEPVDATSIDKEPVMLLALATVKDMLKQADGKQAMDEFETYMKGLAMRLPADAVTFVNNALRRAQGTLYRTYKVFRMERWFTWTEVAGQNFYSMYGDDNAVFSPPTGLTATLGTFGNFGQAIVGRSNSVSVVLSDGRVLFSHGSTGSGAGTPTRTAEVFNPATGLFTAVAQPNVTRLNAQGVLMQNGKVLVFGGQSSTSGSTLSSAEIYDPVANTWTVTGSMVSPRSQFTSRLLVTGNVIAIGGVYAELGAGQDLASLEIYNITTGAWTLSNAVMSQGLEDLACINLNNGTVLIAGGFNGFNATTTNVSAIYNPFTDTLAASGNMTQQRRFLPLIQLPDGTIFTAGGGVSNTTAETYSPVSGAWAATTGVMTTSLTFPSVALLTDGTVLVIAGTTTNIYNPTARTFAAGAVSPVSGTGTFNNSSQIPVLADGRVLYGPNNTSTAAAFYTTGTGWALSQSLSTGTLYFRVAAVSSSGSTLAAPEVSISSVTAGFAINLACNAVVGASQYNWYGRATGAEQLIGTTTVPSFTDFNTNVPNGALPTASTAAPVYTLDARSIVSVNASSNGTNWRPLLEGIPPFCYNATTTGPPQRYKIKQALEVWPPAADATWQIQISGFFKPLPFSADTDLNSIDPHAIYLKAKIECEVHFKRNDPKATAEELDLYIAHLVAGSHNTHRYIPGADGFVMNAVRPILLP